MNYRLWTAFMELSTLVIYDIEDDRARTRVSEACKDFGLERMQFSCFRGILTQNKREELYERLRKIQREWETRWRKDFPEAQTKQVDLPVPPGEEAKGRWQPAFKIMIQPLCEKDVKTALYAYLFADIPKDLDQQRKGDSGDAKWRCFLAGVVWVGFHFGTNVSTVRG